MKILYNWIRELTGTELDPHALAERLTLAGTAVESVERTADAWRGIVVGRVLEAAPLADHLHRCRVARGGGEVEIVCGAPNVRAGMQAALALPGSVLPGGTAIEARSIRGVESHGMLLSREELGLGAGSAPGLMPLDESLAPGLPLAEVLGLDDWVLEAEITHNRGDCLSMLGIAREVVAVGGGSLRLPEEGEEPIETLEGDRATEACTRIVIDDLEGCTRFVARVVEGVAIAPSPLWLAVRLQLMGARPRNNIVDITNFILFERGQPLHPYDLDTIPAGEVHARAATAGETLVTLDGVERKLAAGQLVIADASRPIGVAGVMGGEATEVASKTTRVLIESAHFDAPRVRASAQALGLRTEASYRFERGVDAEGVPRAADRAARLLVQVAGGRLARGRIDVHPRPAAPRKVRFRPQRARRVLGAEIDDAEMRAILGRLGMEVRETGGDALEVAVPSHRNDVTEEIDLVEEVARLHGYDRVPVSYSVPRLAERVLSPRREVRERTREFFTGLGFCEAVTSSLMDERSAVRWLEATGWEGNATARITNPISEAMAVLRPRLLASLVPSLVVNVNRRRGEIRLYEVGVGFTLRAGEPRPAETLRVAGAWSGHAVGPSWDGPGRPADYYDARGLAEAFFDALGLGAPEFRPSGAALFRGATGADLWWRGSQLGWLGEMGPALRQACGVRQEAVLFEWSLEPLVEGWQGVERRHRGLPRFPAVERDIALVVNESAPQGAVERLLRQEGASLLESLRLFDVYRGEPLPAGRKSLAYTMVLRAADRTLTEEEAQELRARIGQRAARELGATLRE